MRFTRTSDEDEGEVDSSTTIGFRNYKSTARAAVKTWSKDASLTKATHKPVSEQVRIEGKLPVGAYLLEAKSGSLSARDLILVTDASLVLKSTRQAGAGLFLAMP